MIILSACQGLRYPPIEDFLVDATAFPQGWHADPEGPEPDPSAPFGGIKSVERTSLDFSSNVATAFETIERFKNSRRARDEFSSQKDFLFKTTEIRGPYEIPNELPYKSDVANQFHFACSPPKNSSKIGCHYLAQYGPYLVQFSFGWDLDTLSAHELEKVLWAIDNKLAKYADK
jgi:hypothetical protein